MQDGWDSSDKREKQGKQGNAKGKSVAVLAEKIFFSLRKKNIHQLPIFPAVAEIPFGIQIFQINPTAQGTLCTKLFRGERRAREALIFRAARRDRKRQFIISPPFCKQDTKKHKGRQGNKFGIRNESRPEGGGKENDMRGLTAFDHYRKLRLRIIECGMLHDEVARSIGRSEGYFSTRITGKKAWDQDDIRNLAKLLDIPPSEWMSFFFEEEAA